LTPPEPASPGQRGADPAAPETPREDVRAARAIEVVQRHFIAEDWDETITTANAFLLKYCYGRPFMGAPAREHCDRATLLSARSLHRVSKLCESIVTYQNLLRSPTDGKTAKGELEQARNDWEKQLSSKSHPVTLRVHGPPSSEIGTVRLSLTGIDGKA